jgi:hypothetical protein
MKLHSKYISLVVKMYSRFVLKQVFGLHVAGNG